MIERNPYRSDRAKAWRNAMVAAINAGLSDGHFDLAGNGPDWRSEEERYRGPPLPAPQSAFDLASLPAIAAFRSVSHDEVAVHVIVKPTPVGQRHVDCGNVTDFAEFGDAIATGWLERRTGKWLQHARGSRELFRCRRHLMPQLAALTIEAQGYRDHGKFFL
jgi:hypothetical protein